MWKDSLLCADITAGEHTIELKYMPCNLILGCVLTALSIIILIGIYISGRLIRKGTIKTDNWPVAVRKYLELPVTASAADTDTDTDADNLLEESIEESILDEMNDFDNLEFSEEDNENDENNNLTDNETKEDL